MFSGEGSIGIAGVVRLPSVDSSPPADGHGAESSEPIVESMGRLLAVSEPKTTQKARIEGSSSGAR